MTSRDLETVALTLVAEGKGILAADETIPTLTRRFDALGIASTAHTRRSYREMLFTSGIAEFISGATLHNETIRQENGDGRPLAELLGLQGFLRVGKRQALRPPTLKPSTACLASDLGSSPFPMIRRFWIRRWRPGMARTSRPVGARSTAGPVAMARRRAENFKHHAAPASPTADDPPLHRDH